MKVKSPAVNGATWRGEGVFSPNSVFNTWGSYGSSKRPGG